MAESTALSNWFIHEFLKQQAAIDSSIGPEESTPAVPTPGVFSPDSSNKAQLMECPEPLVCLDGATATEWSNGRKRKHVASAGLSTEGQAHPEDEGSIRVDDVVVIIPDELSRQQDEAAGYMLPLSFGKVLSVHQAGVEELPAPCVRVAWLRSASMKSKFSIWYRAPGIPNTDYVNLDAIQVEENTGKFIKVEFTSRGTIKPSSKKLLDMILEIHDHDSL